MDLHEFQAKSILTRYGIPVPPGQVAWTAEEAERIAAEMGGTSFAVKAQILAGGRGEAGGVRLARSTGEVRGAAAGLIGSRLVTAQTSAAGRNVRRVYVERAVTCSPRCLCQRQPRPRLGRDRAARGRRRRRRRSNSCCGTRRRSSAACP